MLDPTLFVDTYLDRIRYGGSATPDLSTLKAVHRCHVRSIAYENLDVFLQRPLDHSDKGVFGKLVDQGRGGWCYEHNGLLRWALVEMGFIVTHLCGGVMRETIGDAACGNHLILQVDLGTPWIADVGLGDGIAEPMRLKESTFVQDGRTYELKRLGKAAWRLRNSEGNRPASFDFVTGSLEAERLIEGAARLQADPNSMFRKNLICQRMTRAGTHKLNGRVFQRAGQTGRQRVLRSEAELYAILTQTLRISSPPMQGLWEKICARHVEIFSDASIEEIESGKTT